MITKQQIQEFIDTTTSYKTIHSQEIKKFLSEMHSTLFEKNDNKALKQKLNMFMFDLETIPKCSCGNTLEFVTQTKATLYITNFGGWREFCSQKCSRTSEKTVNKRKQTCLEKFGVDSYAKTTKYKNTASGAWSQEKKDKYNEKCKETNNRKYGADHYSKTKEYITNRTSTCLEKHGVTNTFKLKDKVREGQIKKFGDNKVSWLQTQRGIDFLYSSNSPMRNKETREKSVLTRFLKEFKHVDKPFVDCIINNDKETFISLIDSLFTKHTKCKYLIAEELKIGYSTLCRYIRHFDLQDRYTSPNGVPSKSEKEIYAFVKSLEPTAKQSDRTILKGMELDILVKEKNLAIEYNGIYYHSEYNGNKDKYYHVNKTVQCEQQNIQLLHIFENEWNCPIKQPIWKSIIRQKLGLTTNKIHARKTTVLDITPSIAKEFLDKNHLSGFIGAKYHKGLMHNNTLVSVISIGETRFDNSNSYEIIRFATILDTCVVGGLSKLLKSFNLDAPLVTFADRRLSSLLNSCYSKIFNNIKILPPSWYGFSTKDYNLNHRLSYTKNRLKQKINTYDDNLSCFDNMIKNGYDRIWDCGNLKFY